MMGSWKYYRIQHDKIGKIRNNKNNTDWIRNFVVNFEIFSEKINNLDRSSSSSKWKPAANGNQDNDMQGLKQARTKETEALITQEGENVPN